MSNIKVTEDGFVWLIVTDKAKELYNSGIFELYIVREDDSESLIDTDEKLIEGIEDADVGIEVGKLERKDLYPFFKSLTRKE